MPDTPPPPPPPHPREPARLNKDNLAVNVVITFLGIFSLLGLSFIFCLIMFRRDQPPGGSIAALIALVGTTVGSLGSILAQTRTQPLAAAAEPAPAPARPLGATNRTTTTTEETHAALDIRDHLAQTTGR